MAGATFVIGDIHGCLAEVDRLLDAVAPGRGDQVCFLGDYIDRGEQSKGVVERLLELAAAGPTCTFLKGNHEDMFLAFLGEHGHHGEAFLANGGRATLQSYGLSGRSGGAVAAELPPAHLAFFRDLRLRASFGRFECVHAGLRPGLPFNAQREEDLTWIRGEFIEVEHQFPCTVVFGHTPQRDVRLHLPYKVGLDTGCVYGGQLTCLELAEKRLIQIGRGSRQVRQTSLAGEFARAGVA
jgi:serine/threonine protein phosphatase 1